MGKLEKLWKFFGVNVADDEQTINDPQVKEGGFADQPEGYGFRSKRQHDIGGAVYNDYEEQEITHVAVQYLIRKCDDTQDIIDDMLNRNSVLLNIEELDSNESQRVIDMLSGAAYAEKAYISKVSKNTYYIAPKNVGLYKFVPNEDGSIGGKRTLVKERNDRYDSRQKR